MISDAFRPEGAASLCGPLWNGRVGLVHRLLDYLRSPASRDHRVISDFGELAMSDKLLRPAAGMSNMSNSNLATHCNRTFVTACHNLTIRNTPMQLRSVLHAQLLSAVGYTSLTDPPSLRCQRFSSQFVQAVELTMQLCLFGVVVVRQKQARDRGTAPSTAAAPPLASAAPPSTSAGDADSDEDDVDQRVYDSLAVGELVEDELEEDADDATPASSDTADVVDSARATTARTRTPQVVHAALLVLLGKFDDAKRLLAARVRSALDAVAAQKRGKSTQPRGFRAASNHVLDERTIEQLICAAVAVTVDVAKALPLALANAVLFARLSAMPSQPALGACGGLWV